ncbi:type I glyceraldehyde-3-phosphate dehydrogenase [Robiginitalea aurantiaca]|uniref:Type I glyceraldehyde-3-phosphate dehydrogenase n=1 Tax=Robiginitalea aurantiaca TaxID=3056915 RepID=A0ABT7WHE1_9FLAO|nr:type I glyceraldehyde-3-phosphate dehydrogenase [Robiginitalea aurantiaca]MDM9632340.1 type I glyceraldehyde-3-phosphate dehydrogenase [Robiginitalea aurantiaca]
MKKITLGINGFGRIGRTLFRLLQNEPGIHVGSVNDIADTKTLAHLLKYDSIHGVFPHEVQFENNILSTPKGKTRITHYAQPSEIPWTESEVDLVIEATGLFKTREMLQSHLQAGAPKVMLSAPPPEASIPMIVYGINHETLRPEDRIFSNASCTTHNAAPMIKILDELCGIEQAYITTIHSYTSDQSLHDRPHRDLRRARAAGQSIVPTTTGAAKALTRIFPHLSSAIGGCGIRVPVPNGSLTDITANVVNPTSIQEINATFKAFSQKELKNVLQYTEDPIVSIDINNSCYSCTFDSQMTSVIGTMVKVIGWYDNEAGYSSRIIDTVKWMTEKDYL